MISKIVNSQCASLFLGTTNKPEINLRVQFNSKQSSKPKRDILSATFIPEHSCQNQMVIWTSFWWLQVWLDWDNLILERADRTQCGVEHTMKCYERAAPPKIKMIWTLNKLLKNYKNKLDFHLQDYIVKIFNISVVKVAHHKICTDHRTILYRSSKV